jgi:oxepin-CoA hydrolase/3-oxo-5,6-dehydrosuberyl-CoA semialdehyde dehydrogenase
LERFFRMSDSVAVPKLASYVEGRRHVARGGFVELPSAIDGHVVALASSEGIDTGAMLRYARRVGGANLRKLTFQRRATLLRELGGYLQTRKAELYDVSFDTGATKRDHFFDVDGGIGTLFSFASKARRELPDERFTLDGALEKLSKKGTFAGRHVMLPLHGAALQINAYNFPVWGMLEKFAPAFLAGMPVFVKPATATSYVTAAAFGMMIDSGILPEGAIQLLIGKTGDLLDHLEGQDVVSFTGSLETSLLVRNHQAISEKAVRFIAERDSLNAAILGPDAAPGTPEFDLFIKEVVGEITSKAGQKCTAIRRALVPRAFYEAAAAAMRERLAGVVVGDPRLETVTMGALASMEQRRAVRAHAAELAGEGEIVFGSLDDVALVGADARKGAFFSPLLLACDRPRSATKVHSLEAFGPVSTLMPYDDLGDAIELTRRGEGSLVASIYTHDDQAAAELVEGIGPYHGRIVLIDRDCAAAAAHPRRPRPRRRRRRDGRDARRLPLHAARRARRFAEAADFADARLESRRGRSRDAAASIPARIR